MKAINNINTQAENIYSVLNNWLSDGGTTRHLLDCVYPNHDGKADHETVADLVIMRQTLYSLQMACEKSIERLTEVIDLYDKNEE
jgi:hypothetical protein